MFDPNNRTPRRQGGYRQDENPREQNGATMSADGASIRPRFNPSFTPAEGGRKRQRFTRTAGATRAEKVEPRRNAFRPDGEQSTERNFRPRPKHNAGVYSQRKRQEYQTKYEDPTKPIRLNKYLANAGICSRREADDFIQAGVISVNGEVVDNLGAKVLPTDKVMFHDQPVRRERKVYILLNKPKNTVTTTDDPEERHTVMDIVRNACAERIYPVGRLDRNTTGVLLLTNDGDLVRKLTLPSSNIPRTYIATVNGTDFSKLDNARRGITVDGVKYSPMIIEEIGSNNLRITITEGKKNEVRIVLRACGCPVRKLHRVSYGKITLGNLGVGKIKKISQKTIDETIKSL